MIELGDLVKVEYNNSTYYGVVTGMQVDNGKQMATAWWETSRDKAIEKQGTPGGGRFALSEATLVAARKSDVEKAAKTAVIRVDPDSVKVGNYYVAIRPTIEEQEKTRKYWSHDRIDGISLRCISVGAAGEVKLVKGDAEPQPYRSEWLRDATEEEIESSKKTVAVSPLLPQSIDACVERTIKAKRRIVESLAMDCQDLEQDPSKEAIAKIPTAQDVLAETVAENYRPAAEKIAYQVAETEINQAALIPGMMVWHVFDNKRCVLLEKADDGTWKVEFHGDITKSEIDPQLLRAQKPSKIKSAKRWLRQCFMLFVGLVSSITSSVAFNTTTQGVFKIASITLVLVAELILIGGVAYLFTLAG